MSNLISVERESVIQEIKMATGYDKVYFVDNSYVIDFEITKAYAIKGLRTLKHSFTLDFEFLTGKPVSFLVRTNGSISQYWTLNGQLHRVNDLPASVFINEETKKVISKWFWNGLLHRVNGPAKQDITNYHLDYDIRGLPLHFEESWDELHQEWWKEGSPAVYPLPRRCSIGSGYHIKRKKDNVLDSPNDDFTAVFYDHGVIEWISNDKDDALLPKEMEFIFLSEWHNNGELVNREAHNLFIEWIQGDKELEHISEIDILVNEQLFNDLGLWSAPFYKKDDVEFLLLSEYSRVKDND